MIWLKGQELPVFNCIRRKGRAVEVGWVIENGKMFTRSGKKTYRA